jgi:DNA polymerase III alpha subunit
LPPDINKSESYWSIEGENIRFGFSSITEVGWAAANAITNGQPYVSYADFCQKAPGETNKKHAMALVKAGAFDSVDDREYLLGQVNQWDGNTIKFVVKMSCGCERKKTVKLTPNQIEALLESKSYTSDGPEFEKEYIAMRLREKAEASVPDTKCTKHKDATVVDWEERHDTYTVAEWMRESPGKEPNGYTPPTPQEIALAERESLNISMTAGSPVVRYYDFIEDRIMTEEEVEATPKQPQRKKVRGSYVHGSRCGCDQCEQSRVIVGGEITRWKEITTKTGKKMAFATLAFGADTYDLTFFPEVWKREKDYIKEPTAFMVKGNKNDRGSITVTDIFDVIEVAADDGWEPPPISKPKKAKVVSINTGVKFNSKMKAAA